MTAISPRLFCFGLGYSAEILARRLLAEGWRVAGTVREPARLAALAALGIEAMPFDRQTPLAAGALAGTTHLLSSVPPDAAGDAVLPACEAAIRGIGADLRWIGALSTTAVYGDRGGAWVDEMTSVRPNSERAVWRVEAEDRWLDLYRRHGLPVHLFRLAGIYGPGRSPLDEVRNGTARRIVKPGQVFSRIHVEDIATVLQASMAQPHPGTVYNVCDDEPAAPQEVVAFACALLGRAPPPELPFEEVTLSPMARSFWADCKRVRNRRLHTELGVSLRYPTYREGLRGLLEAA